MGFILDHGVNTLYMNHRNAGNAFFGQGKYPEAFNSYNRAYKIAAQYDDQGKMGECLKDMGRCEERMSKSK